MKTLVRMAFCYSPKHEYKVKEGSETIPYRKAGAPTRPARPTDVNTWLEEKVTDGRLNA